MLSSQLNIFKSKYVIEKGLNVLKKLKMMIIQKISRGYIFNFKAKETVNQAYNKGANFYVYKSDNLIISV